MKNTIIVIVVLVVVLLGGYLLLSSPEATAPGEDAEVEEGMMQEDEKMTEEEGASAGEMEGIVPATPGESMGETETPGTAGSSMPVVGEGTKEMQVSHMVTYTKDGYSPSALSIKLGEGVTFKNASSTNMWPASAMHPTHTAYNGTSLSEHCPDGGDTAFDACKGYAPGASWTFTFSKAGEWRYHDHLTPTLFGKVVVE